MPRSNRSTAAKSDAAEAPIVDSPEQETPAPVEVDADAPVADAEVEVKGTVAKMRIFPTRSKVDMAKPADNKFVGEQTVIYVTVNEKGTQRALMSVAGAEALEVGAELDVKTYGALTVIGQRNADGTIVGIVPTEGKLALRQLTPLPAAS